MKGYQETVRYASNLMQNYSASYSPRDLVHDSFIRYFKSTNNNLFDREPRYIQGVVKNNFYNEIEKGYYIKNGEKHKKQILTVDDGSAHEEVKGEHIETANIFTPEETKNPETILIEKDFIEKFSNKLCEYDKKVLDLKLEGKTSKEIIKTLKTSNDRLVKSVRKIKEEMHTLSPFNGCKVVVVKRVKRKDFEAKKDEYLQDWEMGDKSDYNETFVLMTSKTNPMEGLLIKEKDSD